LKSDVVCPCPHGTTASPFSVTIAASVVIETSGESSCEVTRSLTSSDITVPAGIMSVRITGEAG
jgi:hypothetical protein